MLKTSSAISGGGTKFRREGKMESQANLQCVPSASVESQKEYLELLAQWVEIYAGNYGKEPIEETVLAYKIGLTGLRLKFLHEAFGYCLRKYSMWPAVANIREAYDLVAENNCDGTAIHYDDPRLSEEDKKPFLDEMAVLREKLGVKPKIVRERNTQPFPRSETNYVAMVGSQTLQEWAASQSLSDDLPRSLQEIELIRTIQDYGKPKKRRARLP
jgi:hypothetical protein